MTLKSLSCRRVSAEIEFVDLLEREASFEDAFRAGMAAPEKAIPCRFLYDAEGSALFDRICDLPEYYPTRTEIGILKKEGGRIADLLGENAALIELGSGSSVKTRLLLDRMRAPAAYMPIDVSREHLRGAAKSIAEDYSGLRVVAVCADYGADFALPERDGRRVAFFPGSTIGNLFRDEAVDLLSAWRSRLGENGLMIVGVDLKKDPRRLEAAYNDVAGVTERFIKNILARANRELGADFDLAAFDYDARWNAAEGRVEMHLVSRRRQTARVAGVVIRFEKGEPVHVENSHKYGPEEFAALARRAGFSQRARFIDAESLFSVHVLSSVA